METTSRDEPRHPIGVAARRTGLTAAALRAWERRYGAVRPERTEGGQRRYSDRDVYRLGLLKEAVDGGRAIGQVAGLDTEEVEGLVREDRRARAGSGPGPGADEGAKRDAEEVVRRAMRAVEGMDPRMLERILRRATVRLTPPVLVDGVLAPLMERIGERCGEGELSAAHQGLASAAARRFLAWLDEASDPGPGEPGPVVVASVGGRAELEAALAGVVAALVGRRVVVLGAGLSSPEVAVAARGAGAKLIVFWGSGSGEVEVVEELRELARAAPGGVKIVAGGWDGAASGQECEALDLRYVEGLPGLRAILGSVGAP